MPLVVPVLVSFKKHKPGPYPQPEGGLALALKKLHTDDAVPALAQIVDQASDELVRNCAMEALSELKSSTAVNVYVGHLSDPSSSIRYYALLGMKYVTEAPACSSIDPNESAAAKAELECKHWWESTGAQEFHAR